MTSFEIGSIAVVVIGWPVGYWFVLRSQRRAREIVARDAAAARRKLFLDIATEIRAKIADPGDDMGRWVFSIKEDILVLKTAYDKIDHELPGIERPAMRAAMIDICGFAGMEQHGDIYERGQELYDTLKKIPSA